MGNLLSCSDKVPNRTATGDPKSPTNSKPKILERNPATQTISFDFLNQSIDEVYPMNLDKRGSCLIFNHKKFMDTSWRWKVRVGTDRDRDRLQTTFNSLGFEVETHEDRSKADILNHILPSVAKRDHSNAECLVIVVLTHGIILQEYQKYASFLFHESVCSIMANDHDYLVQQMLEPFTDINCPTLANKPKIFLIQACQGTIADQGIKVTNAISRDEVDASRASSVPPLRIYRPHKDFLIAFSSMPGYFSFRNELHGSWFIQILCDKLDELKYKYDFEKILTIVSKTVAYDKVSGSGSNPNNDTSNKKEMPYTVSMLTKQLFFQDRSTAST